ERFLKLDLVPFRSLIGATPTFGFGPAQKCAQVKVAISRIHDSRRRTVLELQIDRVRAWDWSRLVELERGGAHPPQPTAANRPDDVHLVRRLAEHRAATASRIQLIR